MSPASGALAGLIGVAAGSRLPRRARLRFSALILGVIAGVYPAIAAGSRPRRATALESAAACVLLAWSLAALQRDSRLMVAEGFLAHAGWDLAHDRGIGTSPPAGYPAFCAVADAVLAAALLAARE